MPRCLECSQENCGYRGNCQCSCHGTKAPNGPDDDLDRMNDAQLKAEVLKLRTAIRTLRDATGHQLCWYVPELWAALPEKVVPHPEVPPREEFLARCAEYHATLPRPSIPRFVCPKCSASHHRGFLDGVKIFRCLNCGYQGEANAAPA